MNTQYIIQHSWKFKNGFNKEFLFLIFHLSERADFKSVCVPILICINNSFCKIKIYSNWEERNENNEVFSVLPLNKKCIEKVKHHIITDSFLKFLDWWRFFLNRLNCVSLFLWIKIIALKKLISFDKFYLSAYFWGVWGCELGCLHLQRAQISLSFANHLVCNSVQTEDGFPCFPNIEWLRLACLVLKR